jgi:predicted dehydrogenase
MICRLLEGDMKNQRSENTIRVGLIGVGNWARYGHVPALQSLRDFEITAVSSRQLSKAQELAKLFDIPHALDDARMLVDHPDVDLVVVLPPAPEHAALSRIAIEAGKDIYCEWPLTTKTSDSENLFSQAEAAGVRHVVGLQRRLGASAQYVRDLLAEGYVGRLRSMSMRVSIEYFGPVRPPSLEWTLPAANFSHLLSIYGGHFFDLFFHLVGPPTSVNAIVESQFPTLTLSRTGESFPNETPDEVLAVGRLSGDGVFSVQIEAGKVNNAGLQIEITGTKGNLRISNAKAFGNVTDNLIEGAQGIGQSFKIMEVPARYELPEASALDVSVQDLAHLYASYAADRNTGTSQAPGFREAVTMHRIIDAVTKASESGATQFVTQ